MGEVVPRVAPVPWTPLGCGQKEWSEGKNQTGMRMRRNGIVGRKRQLSCALHASSTSTQRIE